MTASYGSHNLLDTLATIDNANVFDYGEDDLYDHISDLVAIHNELVDDMTGFFVERTTQRIARLGADTATMEMIEVDEYGTADTQKVAVTGYDIGWPLRDYQVAVGWTRRYFQQKTPADIAKDFIASRDADLNNIRRNLLRALYRATNYSFIDRFVDSVTLPVKALINADGSAIPIDEFGATFNGGTHTHLVGYASGAVAAADITALINNVVEHGVNGGEMRLLINKAQAATVMGFSSNFDGFQAPLLDPGPGSTADVVEGGKKTSPYQIDDKPIGVWDGYVPVWIKPWVPANYYSAVLVGGGGGEVLRWRTRPGFGDFGLLFEDENYPMRGQWFSREFGIGVWNRFAAAHLYGGGTSYVQPTIS